MDPLFFEQGWYRVPPGEKKSENGAKTPRGGGEQASDFWNSLDGSLFGDRDFSFATTITTMKTMKTINNESLREHYREISKNPCHFPYFLHRFPAFSPVGIHSE